MHTILRGGKRSGTKSVPVTLAARCTEIGTLELFCVAKDGNNRWRLEFNVRDIVRDADDEGRCRTRVPSTDVWPEELVQAAAGADARPFMQSERPLIRKHLTRSWKPPWMRGATNGRRACAGVCGTFLRRSPISAARRRRTCRAGTTWSASACGPASAIPIDKFRVEQLWKLLHAAPKGAKPGLAQPEGGADFWIMWRRVAGGLATPLQNTLYQPIAGRAAAGKSKASKPPANELTEMWRAAASLERLDLENQGAARRGGLKSCRRSPTPTHAFFALTRLGARVLLYGPLNAVVHPQVVQKWLDAILPFEPAIKANAPPGRSA